MWERENPGQFWDSLGDPRNGRIFLDLLSNKLSFTRRLFHFLLSSVSNPQSKRDLSGRNRLVHCALYVPFTNYSCAKPPPPPCFCLRARRNVSHLHFLHPGWPLQDDAVDLFLLPVIVRLLIRYC